MTRSPRHSVAPTVFPLTALALATALATALALTPRSVEAFCGFYVSGSSEGLYNKATRVALMRQGTRTVLSMSNDYQGPPEDFALVVPVPTVVTRESVRTLPMDVFDHLDALTAPRLVEYWEQDPCVSPSMEFASGTITLQSSVLAGEQADDSAHGVRVEARFTVGEYAVVVLSATESDGLETWLRERQYRIPAGAGPWLAPYVRGGWRFFVARVDLARAHRLPDGGARLSPLRMSFDAREFRLPVRLGLLNAPPGAQDLIVYVLHPTSRFEVANLHNAFVPTNIEVTEGVRGQFPAFYAGLFDATMQSAGRNAVVTEYAWSTGGCDPCPTPPLDTTELATLGADVLDDFRGNSMVVTRLHTRYNAATLTDDLVFREALPITGGRETADGGHGAQPTARGNTFQSRYVIRHPWPGPVACEHPRRGVWGGPPGSSSRLPQTTSARELATAQRDGLDLASMVLSPYPGVNLRARLVLPPVPASTTPPSTQPGVIPATGIRRGCACDAPGAHTNGPLGAWVIALVLGTWAGAVRVRERHEGRKGRGGHKGHGHRPTRSITETSAARSPGQ